MTFMTQWPSPVGKLTIACSERALTGLWMEGARGFARGLSPDAVERETPLHREAEQYLTHYFAGDRPDMELPLAPAGTAFQQAVWQALLEIPYGQTRSYSELAEYLGRPAAIRAVAGAVGKNPISILIPCHRVIGKDGSLTGFAGGMERKRFLLALERGKA